MKSRLLALLVTLNLASRIWREEPHPDTGRPVRRYGWRLGLAFYDEFPRKPRKSEAQRELFAPSEAPHV